MKVYGDVAISASSSRKTPDDVYHIKLLGNNFCCGKMDEAWDEAIAFGEDREGGTLNEEDTVNIYYVTIYPGTDLIFHSYPIKFCPFCAEPVEYEEAPPVTMVKRVKEIPARQEVKYDEVLVEEGEGDA